MSSTQEVGDIFGAGKGHAQAMLRSPTVLILCIGLWGMNLFFYKLFGLDYKYIFQYDLIEIDKEEKDKKKERIARGTKMSPKTKTKLNRILRRNGGNGGSDNGGVYTEAATSEQDIEMVLQRSPAKKVSSRISRSPLTPTQLQPLGRKLMLPILDNKEKIHTSSSSSAPAVLQTANTAPLSLSDQQQQPTTIAELFSSGTGSGTGVSSSTAAIVWYKLVVLSLILLVLLHTTTQYWMGHAKRGGAIGALGFFYAICFLYICIPLKHNAWLRDSLYIILRRSWALIHPRCSCIRLLSTPNIAPRRIPFIDVFYADAMCSLSKVFFDWGMLSHQAVHYPNPVPPAIHNIVIPSLCAAIPYLIRARQCLIMYTVGRVGRDPKKYQHLMNAFKYSTSMYPLILSAYLKTRQQGTTTTTTTSGLDTLLIVLMIINASYSLYWDIVMDWGMMQDPYKVAQTACRMDVPSFSSSSLSSSSSLPTSDRGHNTASAVASNGNGSTGACHHLWLRPRLRYGFTLSTLIVIADSFLRFSWTLKFVVPTLFPTNDAFVLCTQFLEVFRRAIWNLLRVEWENMKQQQHKLSSSMMTPLSLSAHNNKNSNELLLSLHHGGKAPDSLSDHGDPDDEEQEEHEFEMHPLNGGGSSRAVVAAADPPSHFVIVPPNISNNGIINI
mmetsp:Transcript_17698/g.20273  ORF Transcript_17698/g.20273 Transcript_17698/m.20273 type:complete len:667 (-) Transcript_17698:208-2208(-)